MKQFLKATILVFIPLLTISYSVLADLEFYFPSTPEAELCRKNVETWIQQSNSHLPPDWRPTDTVVLYSGTESYYSVSSHNISNGELQVVEQVLHIGQDCLQEVFIHEYGHAVLDHIMRKGSPHWEYYVTWDFIDFKNMEEVRDMNADRINTIKELREEF